MELNSIAALYGGYVDSILNGSGQTGGVSPTNANGSREFSAPSQGADSSQLSPIAQIFNTLQQLQETNLDQYQMVTQKIATNLQSAAEKADSVGNSDAASQLNQLATHFRNASISGELPDIQALAHVIGYELPIANEERSWNFTSVPKPLFATNPAFHPLSIILNTLSSSGRAAHA
jgi:hypothetical protein